MHALEIWKHNTVLSVLQFVVVGWLWLIDPQLANPLFKSTTLSIIALLVGLLVAFFVITIIVWEWYNECGDAQLPITMFANLSAVFLCVGGYTRNALVLLFGVGFLVIACKGFTEGLRDSFKEKHQEPRWLIFVVRFPWGIGTVFGGIALLVLHLLQKRRMQTA